MKQKTRIFGLLKNLLSYNFRTLFLFELFYKLFAYGLFTPLLIWLVETSIHLAGLHYLSAATVEKWLASPYTWAMIVVVILLFCCYFMIDITAVIICLDCTKRKEYVSAVTLLWESLKGVTRMFYWKNLPVGLLVLILLPILGLPFVTGYITSFQIPAFAGNAVRQFLQEYWILILILAIVLIAAFRYVYSFFYYILEKKSFLGACKSSHYLIYGTYFKDLLRLFLWQILCYFIYAMIVASGILLIIGLASLFRSFDFVHALMISIIQSMMRAVNVLYSALVVPLSMIFLSLLFYQNKEIIGEPLARPGYKAKEYGLSKKKKHIVMLLAVLALVLLNISNVNRLAEGALSSKTQIAHRTEVTAHRGYSAENPENTLPAFEAALDCGADWIELDVQQTADGVLIVMHDSNLLRTTGVNRNVWEVAYEEIRDLDAGSYMGEEFAQVGICTLEEVLEEYGNRVHLNIELKPTGHERNFVPQVVDLINAYDCAENCVLASMSYGILKEAKEYDSRIRTVYVMKTAYGYFADLECADAFSVQNTYITEYIVQSVHLQGKQIYAWTVNSRKNMERMIQLGVDNLITDQPLRARQIVFELESSNILKQYFHMLTSLFRFEQI